MNVDCDQGVRQVRINRSRRNPRGVLNESVRAVSLRDHIRLDHTTSFKRPVLG